MEPMTRVELLTLPAVVDVPTAGRTLGFARIHSYEMARAGAFPVPVLKIGRNYRVPTAPLLAYLGIDPATAHHEHTPDLTTSDEATIGRMVRVATPRVIDFSVLPTVIMGRKRITIDPDRSYVLAGQRVRGIDILQRRTHG